MKRTDLIIKSNLSKANAQPLDSKQLMAVETSMSEFALIKIQEFREQENKSAAIEAVGLFPALIKGEWKMWLRKRSFLKAKKLAQKMANIERRPFYVIRSTEISYIVQSSQTARELRKRGVYKKNVNAIKLRETSDYVANPINR